MATPLLAADARTLRATRVPTWQRLLVRIAGFLIAAGGLAAIMVTGPYAVCSDASPCQPSFGATIVAALLIALVITGAIDAIASAWVAAAFAVGFLAMYRTLYFGPSVPVWASLMAVCLPLAYVGLAFLQRPRRSEAATAWRERVVRRQLPATGDRPPAPGRWLRASAVGLGVVAIAFGAWSTSAQAQAEARERAARTVIAVVVAHPDEFSVTVRLPDGSEPVISVVDANYHPVGQPMALFVDDFGLHQPVSEPYDGTVIAVPGVLAGAAGLACWRVADVKRRRYREHLSTPQPVTGVIARPWRGDVVIYTSDARLGDAAVGVVRADVPASPAWTPMTAPSAPPAGAGPWPGWAVPVPAPAAFPAVLYGEAVPGAWCSLEVDSRLWIGRAPLADAVGAPRFTPPA